MIVMNRIRSGGDEGVLEGLPRSLLTPLMSL